MAAERSDKREDQHPNNKKEDGMSNKMIMRIVENLAERDTKRRPHLTQPIKWEPENAEQGKDNPTVTQTKQRQAPPWALMIAILEHRYLILIYGNNRSTHTDETEYQRNTDPLPVHMPVCHLWLTPVHAISHANLFDHTSRLIFISERWLVIYIFVCFIAISILPFFV
ncbi:hypothetical protein [Dictyobacter alpinus]|nr:hypothetical protein [Dictyobacter alpinus]